MVNFVLVNPKVSFKKDFFTVEVVVVAIPFIEIVNMVEEPVPVKMVNVGVEIVDVVIVIKVVLLKNKDFKLKPGVVYEQAENDVV